MVQWLRLYAPDAGGPGLIPGQVIRFPHAATKDPTGYNKDQNSFTPQLRPRVK